MANLSNINGKFVVEQTTGYIGVGTEDPNYPIEVLNSSAEIALNASGASIYRLRSDSTDAFRINKNGVGDRLVIAGDGDVGIGTTDSPGARIDIKGIAGSPATSGTTQNGILRIQNATNNNTLDIGQVAGSPYGTWLQAADKSSLGTSNVYPLILNLLGGNVGVGTDSPDFALDIEAVSSGVQLQMGRTTTSAGSTWMGSDSNGFHLGVGAYGAGNSVSDPNGFTVLTSGNVGIGVSNPGARLELDNPSAFTNMIEYGNVAWNQNTGHGLVAINRGSDGYVQLQITSGVDNADVFTIRNSGTGANIQHNFLSNGNAYHAGNVGIGVNTLTGNGGLMVTNTAGTFANANQKRVASFYDGSVNANNPGIVLGYDDSSTPHGIVAARTQTGSGTIPGLQFFTYDGGWGPRMTILNTGNVGIGATNPYAKLEVTGNLSNNWAGRFENTNSIGYGILAKINSTDSSDYIFQARTGSTNVMTILGDGNVGIGTTSPANKLEVEGNIKAKDVDGKIFSMAASWAYVASKNDLFSYPGTDGAVWEYTIKMNPNSAGSGLYRDFYYGKLGIGIGWNGSNVTQYIWQQQDQTAPRTLYNSGGGNYNPLFRMYYSGGVYTELAHGTAWTLRIQGLSTSTYGDIFFRRLA